MTFNGDLFDVFDDLIIAVNREDGLEVMVANGRIGMDAIYTENAMPIEVTYERIGDEFDISVMGIYVGTIACEDGEYVQDTVSVSKLQSRSFFGANESWGGFNYCVVTKEDGVNWYIAFDNDKPLKCHDGDVLCLRCGHNSAVFVDAQTHEELPSSSYGWSDPYDAPMAIHLDTNFANHVTYDTDNNGNTSVRVYGLLAAVVPQDTDFVFADIGIENTVSQVVEEDFGLFDDANCTFYLKGFKLEDDRIWIRPRDGWADHRPSQGQTFNFENSEYHIEGRIGYSGASQSEPYTIALTVASGGSAENSRTNLIPVSVSLGFTSGTSISFPNQPINLSL